MPSMIESLIGSGVVRPDNKRALPVRRPLPQTPRDLMELFMALGSDAGIPGLQLAADFRNAEPRGITYAVLNRWPTEDEMRLMPQGYTAGPHLRMLLGSQEFRQFLVQRICEVFAERQRLLYVQIPRCAGAHFSATVEAMHAMFPEHLGPWRKRDEQSFLSGLGTYLAKFNLMRTIMVTSPALTRFIQPGPPEVSEEAGDGLKWAMVQPLRRINDRLFAIIREPKSLILSQVNMMATALRGPRLKDTMDVAAMRRRYPPVPDASDDAAWKSFARDILMTLDLKNPLCTALGDGTAKTALRLCRLWDIELVDLSMYPDWVKYTWSVEPEAPAPSPPPILSLATLDEQAAARVTSLVSEDVIFYARYADELAKVGGFKPLVRGRDL